MSRPKEELDSTTNRSVYDKLWKRLKAGCPFCPWHRNENEGHRPKHEAKPKRNDHHAKKPTTMMENMEPERFSGPVDRE